MKWFDVVLDWFPNQSELLVLRMDQPFVNAKELMNQLEVTKVVKLVLYLTLFTTFVCPPPIAAQRAKKVVEYAIHQHAKKTAT